MKLSIISRDDKEVVVLLDNKMRIVKPVYNYLKYLKLRNKSVNTIRAYGRDLKLYWEFLDYKQYNYQDITPNMIGEFLEYLHEPIHNEKVEYVNVKSKRTGRTINRILSTVNTFYRYQARIERIHNPILMDEMNRPFNMFKGLLHHGRKSNKIKRSIFKVKENKKAVNIINDSEADEFINALSRKRDRIIFKLMYLAGMRIGEILGLQIEDIPMPNNCEYVGVINIFSRDSNRYDQQNKSGQRPVFVPKSLIEEIDYYIINERLKIDTEHNYLFVSYQKQNIGKPLTYRGLYEVYKRISRKIGIKLNFHDLRHSFVTHMVEKGIDISVVRLLAGHKSIYTTEKYTHLSDKHLKATLERYWNKSSLIGGIINEA